ncbi:unnamed protein product [Arabis nemorensis]|uniref:Uncharacterized protein n=1 Tax=Arabis nemorensis TaxID=586526 RepID=A0A565BU91_9BRAS|nr:unnamed protein product [Arabis nemorensis]
MGVDSLVDVEYSTNNWRNVYEAIINPVNEFRTAAELVDGLTEIHFASASNPSSTGQAS